MPKELEEGVFKKLFELAEIAKMKPKDRVFYEDSLKDYWDLKSSMETYFKEGKAEGKAENKAEIAKSALKKGLGIDLIQELTGLSKEEIEKLR